MTPSEVIARAEHARQLLADELLNEVFDGIDAVAVARIASCDVNDTKTLQAYTLALQTVRSVRHVVRTMLSVGEAEVVKELRRELEPNALQRFRRRA